MYICILKVIWLVNRHWFFHIPCTLLSFKTLTFSTMKTCRALSTNKAIFVVVVVVVVTMLCCAILCYMYAMLFYPMPRKIQPIRGQDSRCIFCCMQWVVFTQHSCHDLLQYQSRNSGKKCARVSKMASKRCTAASFFFYRFYSNYGRWRAAKFCYWVWLFTSNFNSKKVIVRKRIRRTVTKTARDIIKSVPARPFLKPSRTKNQES